MRLTIDPAKTVEPVRDNWLMGVNTCHAALLTRSDLCHHPRMGIALRFHPFRSDLRQCPEDRAPPFLRAEPLPACVEKRRLGAHALPGKYVRPGIDGTLVGPGQNGCRAFAADDDAEAALRILLYYHDESDGGGANRWEVVVDPAGGGRSAVRSIWWART
jgi:hypothetical protein